MLVYEYSAKVRFIVGNFYILYIIIKVNNEDDKMLASQIENVYFFILKLKNVYDITANVSVYLILG